MAESDEEELMSETIENSSKIFKVQSLRDDYIDNLSTAEIDLYVKDVDPTSCVVKFSPCEISVRFQTTNEKFVSENDGDISNVWTWEEKLAGEIVPEKCSFKVKNEKIQLKLQKKESVRWSTFRMPPQIQNSVSKTIISPSLGAVAKKPMCKVSPFDRGGSSYDDKPIFPLGYTGLDNIGNTCFMGSALQCIANTPELMEFCQSQKFQEDLNRTNPLGMGGKLAVSFQALLKNMWSGKLRSTSPTQLKHLVGMKNSQFMGFAQHDSHEFMSFLLNGLHEDLNRVLTKPYIPHPEDEGRADEELARDFWLAYKKRNDSIVSDLFQGQFKSVVICPSCNKVSTTFDPFMDVSVPLPRPRKSLVVKVFFKEPSKRPVQMKVSVPADTTVAALKKQITAKLVSASLIPASPEPVFIVAKVFKSRFEDFPKNHCSVGGIYSSDLTFYEVLDPNLLGEETVEIRVIQRRLVPKEPTKCSYCRKSQEDLPGKLHLCTACYKAAYCDENCQKQDLIQHRVVCRDVASEVTGYPFVVSLPRSQATFRRLAMVMEEHATQSMDVFQPPLDVRAGAYPGQEEEGELPSEAAGGGDAEPSEDEDGDTEMTSLAPSPTEEEEREVQQQNKNTRQVLGNQRDSLPRPGPSFLIKPVGSIVSSEASAQKPLEDLGDTTPLPFNKNVNTVVMEWQNKPGPNIHALVQEKAVIFENLVQANEEDRSGRNSTTLEECLDLFTEPERLTHEEAWYCPRCKSHKEATKQISLWRLPSNLIIHLKRFKVRNSLWSDKEEKLVRFPTVGLDLSRYVTNPREKTVAIYDLYAVVNHYGSMLGGHYTAYARLPDAHDSRESQIGWRCCDDSRVSDVSDAENVVSAAAYVLFYRRRLHPPPEPLPPVVQSPTTPLITSLEPPKKIV